MLESFAWGLAAAGSLVWARSCQLSKDQSPIMGLIMAFGIGVLIGAVAFELAEGPFTASHRGWVLWPQA